MMKKATVVVLFLAALLCIKLLPQDSAIRAQEERPVEAAKVQPQSDADLLTRIELLEDLVNFHSHDRELRELHLRLDKIESSLETRSTNSPASTAIRPQPSSSNDVRDLQHEVARLTTKLSTLERSIGPLKQDIAKLRLSMTRVESSVARIDLSR